MLYVGITLLLFVLLWVPHQVSYRFMKNRILKRQKWGLHICCGKIDGGGVNTDIFRHAGLPRFQIIEDIYHLPFSSKKFDSVLCSQTLEHIGDPDRFFEERKRVGRQVVLVLPPLRDITAALNIFGHRRIFFKLKTEHHFLPRRMRLPMARTFQHLFGQHIHS